MIPSFVTAFNIYYIKDISILWPFYYFFFYTWLKTHLFFIWVGSTSAELPSGLEQNHDAEADLQKKIEIIDNEIEMEMKELEKLESKSKPKRSKYKPYKLY